jgi:inosine-uridine nucleoside N-ribohydrolase
MRVIIDTDGEFDDALALIYALMSEDLEVEAITTVHGIRPIDNATNEVLNIIELLSRNTPVFKGLANPLLRDSSRTQKRILDIWKKGGRTNTDPLKKPKSKPQKEKAVAFLTNFFKENPGEINLVTLGALTNIAVALNIEPELSDYIKSAYTMGGAILAPGNSTPTSEFNIWGDPEAAKVFFNSGLPITLVDLYTYYQPRPNNHQWKIIENANEATKYVFHTFKPWIDYLRSLSEENAQGLQIGDALALSVMNDKNVVETIDLRVDVETKGELTVGMTVPYGLSPRDKSPFIKNVKLCKSVNSENFIKDFIDIIKK